MDNGVVFGYTLMVICSIVMLWASLASLDASKAIKKAEEDRNLRDAELLKELERLRKLFMSRRRY